MLFRHFTPVIAYLKHQPRVFTIQHIATRGVVIVSTIAVTPDHELTHLTSRDVDERTGIGLGELVSVAKVCRLIYVRL